jgi:hypothetical protein
VPSAARTCTRIFSVSSKKTPIYLPIRARSRPVPPIETRPRVSDRLQRLAPGRKLERGAALADRRFAAYRLVPRSLRDRLRWVAGQGRRGARMNILAITAHGGIRLAESRLSARGVRGSLARRCSDPAVEAGRCSDGCRWCSARNRCPPTHHRYALGSLRIGLSRI